MSISVYEDKNYGGLSMHFGLGDYDKQTLTDDKLYKKISSIKVAEETIVMLSDMSAISSNGTRVLLGPINIPDLSTLGINDEITSIRVRAFTHSTSDNTHPVVVYTDNNFGGKSRELLVGNYPIDKLTSGANAIADNSISSIDVPAGYVVILYDGPNFDTNLKSISIIGPARIPDLSVYGIDNATSSIKIVSINIEPENKLRELTADVSYKSRQQRGLHKLNPNFIGDLSHDHINDSTAKVYKRQAAPSNAGALLQKFVNPKVHGGTKPVSTLHKPKPYHTGAVEGFCPFMRSEDRALEPGIYANSPDLLYDARELYSKVGLRFMLIILIVLVVLLTVHMCSGNNDNKKIEPAYARPLDIQGSTN